MCMSHRREKKKKMINPITQLLITKRQEMNMQLQELEKQWRKGVISFEVYSERSKQLIKDQYILECKQVEEAHNKDVNKDHKPTGLLGIALRAIRKIFH